MMKKILINFELFEINLVLSGGKKKGMHGIVMGFLPFFFFNKCFKLCRWLKEKQIHSAAPQNCHPD